MEGADPLAAALDVAREDLEARAQLRPRAARLSARKTLVRRGFRPAVRQCTIDPDRLARGALAAGAALYPPAINAAAPMPGTWGECQARGLGLPSAPCPYVRCKYSLYLEPGPRKPGSLLLLAPDREPWELAETCALRVAARGGRTLDEVGDCMNITRERVRQIEARALAKLARAGRDAFEAPPERADPAADYPAVGPAATDLSTHLQGRFAALGWTTAQSRKNRETATRTWRKRPR